uniref:Potassium channel tetramerisation-type BTB domain-containing protein n=1 Tax=Panagrolaimus sp. ES5 TaxID=591445 RepID=A0AC34EYU7_9BILA
MDRSISHEPSRPAFSREATIESIASCDIPLPPPSTNHLTLSPDRSTPSTVPNGIHPSSNDPLFKLNIGGKSFKIRIDAVMTCRQPSLLTSLIKASHEQRILVVDGYIEETGEYYMERNVRVADHILDYYVTGLLHKPNDVCNERFKEELDFWKLRHDQVSYQKWDKKINNF